MEITEIDSRIEVAMRIAEIGERLSEIQKEQSASSWELAKAQGTDEQVGLSIDPLTEWAFRMRKLNTEAKALIQERKSLRASKRQTKSPCFCGCCSHN